MFRSYTKEKLEQDLKILFDLTTLKIEKYYILTYNYSQENIGVEKYVLEMNFKKFYNDFAEFLSYNNSTRILDAIYFDDDKKLKGEFYGEIGRLGEDPDNGTRVGNLFEKKYKWYVKPDESVEFEIVWEFRGGLEDGANSWFFAWFEVINRNTKINQKIIDGKKTELYYGKYEIRNKFIYHNKTIFNKLLKLKFLTFFTKKNNIDNILKTGEGELSSFHHTMIYIYFKYVYKNIFLFDLKTFKNGRAEFFLNFVRKYFTKTKL